MGGTNRHEDGPSRGLAGAGRGRGPEAGPSCVTSRRMPARSPPLSRRPRPFRSPYASAHVPHPTSGSLWPPAPVSAHVFACLPGAPYRNAGMAALLRPARLLLRAAEGSRLPPALRLLPR